MYPVMPMVITQQFGVNPAAYKGYGLAGHNGWDFRTKFPDTPDGKRPIWASHESIFYAKGDEGKVGYGLYFEVIVHLKRSWKLTYAHCSHINDFDRAFRANAMATSGNTGNSTGPHVHLTTKPGRVLRGKFVNEEPDNGYKGAVNPALFFGELVSFINDQGGAIMQPDFKAFVLGLAKDVYGDEYNENWNAQEKQVFLGKLKEKSAKYKAVAEKPTPPVVQGPATAADAFILAGNLMKEGKLIK